MNRALCARRVLARELRGVETCASTNDLLRAELAERGGAATGGALGAAGPSMLICAEEQSGGRGRRARDWWAGPPGSNLACTLSIPEPPEPPLLLSLLGGCALAAAVERLVPAPVTLKWPNDLLVGGGKAAGLLGELPAGGDGSALLGLGVNVGAAPPAGTLPYPAACLHDHAPVRREDLLVLWLWGLERRLARLRVAGPAELESECLRRLRAWAPHGVQPVGGGTAGPLLEFTVSGGLAWGREGAMKRLPLGQVPELQPL